MDHKLTLLQRIPLIFPCKTDTPLNTNAGNVGLVEISNIHKSIIIKFGKYNATNAICLMHS